MKIAVGEPLQKFMNLAIRANRPVLLHGRHGVGKSEVLAEVAASLRIQFVPIDLSLLEPVDLTGIPSVRDGLTYPNPPAFLPREGQGLLVFEELNRCERYVRVPCLQLLTARKLNSYTLPPGWLPCAAINDAGDGYEADELDPALLSRFVQIWVVPDVNEWTRWARAHQVHPKIVAFVEHTPGIFDDPDVNPRAWTYASDLLTAWEAAREDQDTLVGALTGVLTEIWAVAFLQWYTGDATGGTPLLPLAILDEYPAHRSLVLRWHEQGRLDALDASLRLLQRHIQPHEVYEDIRSNLRQWANVEDFLDDVPAELRASFDAWLADRGLPPRQLSQPPLRRPRRQP